MQRHFHPLPVTILQSPDTNPARGCNTNEAAQGNGDCAAPVAPMQPKQAPLSGVAEKWQAKSQSKVPANTMTGQL
jgi:hypothetical protein